MAVLRSGVSMLVVLSSVIAPGSVQAARSAVPQSDAFQFPARLEGDFTQVGEMPLSGGKETTTITGHVVWRIKADQGGDLREYEVVTLKLSARVSGSASGQIGVCQHDGSVEATPTVEQRRQLALTIDSASQASLRLALVDGDVSYDVKYRCKGPLKVPPYTQHEHGLTVSLGGPHVAPLKDGKVAGAVPQPIHIGEQTITGNWKFVVTNGAERDR